MKIESKYEIGQKLWEIELKCDWTDNKCEHCGHRIYNNQKWVLNDVEQEIHDIGYSNGHITYKVWRPFVYREYLPESDIGRTYFTSREAALEEIDKRNKEIVNGKDIRITFQTGTSTILDKDGFKFINEQGKVIGKFYQSNGFIFIENETEKYFTSDSRGDTPLIWTKIVE